MPHVVAVLAHFGDVNSIVLTCLRAGKYTGVDGDFDKPSEIPCETFAEARFLFRSHQGTKAEGIAHVGKGIRGVRALGPDYDRATKLLLIEDRNGRSVKFDFRKAGAGHPSQSVWIDELGMERYRFDLYAEPYYVFLRSIISPEHLDDRIGLPIEVGKRTLELIEELRYPILEKLRSDPLTTYPCGIYGKRESMYLEEILAAVPPLYGRDLLTRRTQYAR